VFAGDEDRGHRIARRIDCGTVCVDDPYRAAFVAIDAPMGGMDESGIGRRHGPEGIRRYTAEQTVTVQRAGPLDVPDWVPWPVAVRLTSWFFRARRRVDEALR
jgi:succinate-semialdehyde dehydrogenase/glutarate-semialdehyde dehydrogenase